MLDLFPPQEEALGTSGTACEYGAVRLQLFPGRGGKRTISGKGYQPVSGVGEGGYFRDNGNFYAELMVWTGKHSLDLQVSVPSGRTAEALKPDVVALARHHREASLRRSGTASWRGPLNVRMEVQPWHNDGLH